MRRWKEHRMGQMNGNVALVQHLLILAPKFTSHFTYLDFNTHYFSSLNHLIYLDHKKGLNYWHYLIRNADVLVESAFILHPGKFSLHLLMS